MMTSRPGAENPAAADHKVPRDPGCTKPGGGPLVDMPVPAEVNPSGSNILDGTAHPEPAHPGSGWSYGTGARGANNPPSALSQWVPTSHPALR
jgi:hypothetical protein